MSSRVAHRDVKQRVRNLMDAVCTNIKPCLGAARELRNEDLPSCYCTGLFHDVSVFVGQLVVAERTEGTARALDSMVILLVQRFAADIFNSFLCVSAMCGWTWDFNTESPPHCLSPLPVRVLDAWGAQRRCER